MVDIYGGKAVKGGERERERKKTLVAAEASMFKVFSPERWREKEREAPFCFFLSRSSGLMLLSTYV